MEYLSSIEHTFWLWIILGGILLTLELLGVSGYCFWTGTSAIVIGILSYYFTFNWQWQCLLFAILALVLGILWWYWLSHKKKITKKDFYLNQRNKQLIGLTLTLEEDIHDHISRIKIGDGTWRIYAEENLTKGTKITITAVKGITLIVEPITPAV